MTKSRKVDLLYKIAKGQLTDATSSELRELNKYKVDKNEPSKFVKRDNISKYVSAVDNGSRRSFYDFCVDNRLADRRRKGSDKESIAKDDTGLGIAWMLMGWITWGVAIFWAFHGKIPVGSAAVIGAVISFCLCKFNRKAAVFSVFILPIALLSIFAK